jgi:hypothetical protein
MDLARMRLRACKTCDNCECGFASTEEGNLLTEHEDWAHHMAIKAAQGDGLPQDWAAVLDHLQRSAQLGSRLAHAELAALSQQWGLAHDILREKRRRTLSGRGSAAASISRIGCRRRAC